MNHIGQSERATQDRVISLFRNELGYRYLGDWTDRPNNSNIDVGLLTAYLTKSGYSPSQISRALDRLITEAGRIPVERDTLYRKVYRENGGAAWTIGEQIRSLVPA